MGKILWTAIEDGAIEEAIWNEVGANREIIDSLAAGRFYLISTRENLDVDWLGLKHDHPRRQQTPSWSLLPG